MHRRLVLSLLLGLLLSAPKAWAADDSGVTWAQGRLSVQAGQQPLVEVLKTIRARAGIEIRGDGALTEVVARGFEGLPLAEGLKRLLADHNHMIVQRGPRLPLLVVVLGGAGSGPGLAAAPRSAMPAAAPMRPPPIPASAQQAAQQAALQAAQQQAAAQTAQQAAQHTAMNDSDPATRMAAIGRLAEMAQKGDANSVAALQQALNDPSEAVRAAAQQALAARDGTPLKVPRKR
jgi:hypothetical protein